MRVGEPGSGKSGNLKSDGCLTPRSGVRALAQGASPGIDFRDKTSREAAAELQILPPLRVGMYMHTRTPSACAQGYVLTPLRGLGILLIIMDQ